MKKLIFLIIGLLFISSVYASNLAAPPPLAESPVSLQHYLQEIRKNINLLETTEDNPDGARPGKKGEKLHLQTGGKFYDCTNTDGDMTWRCVELTDTP
jgi:hypothetical protein